MGNIKTLMVEMSKEEFLFLRGLKYSMDLDWKAFILHLANFYYSHPDNKKLNEVKK